MQRQFLIGLLLMLLLNLIVKPFYIIGIEAEVQNVLGNDTYGLYFALLNLSFLFNILLDFGINNYNTKNIAESPQILGKYFGSLVSLRSLLFVVYAFITLVSGLLLGYNQVSMLILFWLIGNQFLVSTLQFIRSNLTGLHLFKWDSFFSVLDRLLLIISCSLLLWWDSFPFELTIYTFIGAQTIAYGCAVLIGFIVILGYAGQIKIKLKRVFTYAVIRKTWPYALLVLLMMFYNRIDGIMLERISPLGSKEAGYYAQGFRLFDAINMIALIFAGLLLPIFARLLKNKEDVNPMIRLSSQILLPIGIIIGVSAFYFQEEIIKVRYDDVSQQSNASFGLLMLSAFPVFLTYIYGTLITASGKMKILNRIAAVGIVSNIVLNFILIPKYGAFGAAVATLATQSVTALFQFGFAVKIMGLNQNLPLVIKYLVLSVLVVTFSIVSKAIDVNWLLQWLMVMIAGALVAIILKMWNIQQILALLSSSKENDLS